VYDYSGINGSTSTESSNVYDVLRQMLIFHSKSFQK